MRQPFNASSAFVDFCFCETIDECVSTDQTTDETMSFRSSTIVFFKPRLSGYVFKDQMPKSLLSQIYCYSQLLSFSAHLLSNTERTQKESRSFCEEEKKTPNCMFMTMFIFSERVSRSRKIQEREKGMHGMTKGMRGHDNRILFKKKSSSKKRNKSLSIQIDRHDNSCFPDTRVACIQTREPLHDDDQFM